MPTRLPVTDFVGGLMRTILQAVRFWFHYILVAFAWLGVVPLTACKLHRILGNNLSQTNQQKMNA